MKSLTRLWQVIAEDFSAICDTPIERDVLTVLSRVEEEGLSFLTITLPRYCSDFETCLSQRHVGSNLFLGFKKRGGLPTFLSGFLLRIFDGQSLQLLESPCINAIRAIRQLCLILKKVEVDCTDARKHKAIQQFKQCEVDLLEVEKGWDNLPLRDFRRVSSLLFGSIFDDVNRKVNAFEIVPSHGPGATADRKVGNQKFAQPIWTERLENYFPFGEYAIPNWRWFSDHAPDYLEPSQELPVKITLVPKTLKTPRVIAIEPTCMQYMQQGLREALTTGIERTPITREFTHFTDQQINKDAAREASSTGRLATLDLSEASDRVSNRLVKYMLKPWTDLVGAVDACRSTHAQLPDGEILPLRKFASMGSALTFPVEAMVFTTIVLMGIERTLGITFHSRQSMARVVGSVHVYGDDMIVPVESVHEVVGLLETFGLKVNHTKSFSEGNFRESCGGDYFNGQDVRPFRLKHLAPTSRQSVSEVLSWNASMNAAFDRGMERTGKFMQGILEEALGKRLTPVPRNSDAIGVHSDVLPDVRRTSRWTQTIEVPCLRVRYAHRKVGVDGVWALHKCLTGAWSDPRYAEHLEHSGRPLSARIQQAWVAWDFNTPGVSD